MTSETLLAWNAMPHAIGACGCHRFRLGDGDAANVSSPEQVRAAQLAARVAAARADSAMRTAGQALQAAQAGQLSPGQATDYLQWAIDELTYARHQAVAGGADDLDHLLGILQGRLQSSIDGMSTSVSEAWRKFWGFTPGDFLQAILERVDTLTWIAAGLAVLGVGAGVAVLLSPGVQAAIRLAPATSLGHASLVTRAGAPIFAGTGKAIEALGAGAGAALQSPATGFLVKP